MISVELVYADRTSSFECTVRVGPAATIMDVITRSGVLGKYPEIDLDRYGTGIFGEALPLDAGVYEGARVEIYKPLPRTPVEARRQKAEPGRKGGKPWKRRFVKYSLCRSAQ